MSSLWERSPDSLGPGARQSGAEGSPARRAPAARRIGQRAGEGRGRGHTSHSLAGCWWQVHAPYSLMITSAPSMWLGL